MTDIRITTPITIHVPQMPRLHFPRLELGELLASVYGLLGDALLLATCGYHSRPARPARIFPADDLDGRDPSW